MNQRASAALYVRVSTDAQERDGTSLETQERACREFAGKAGWPVIECFQDTASGFTLERTGIQRLREVIRQGRVGVIVAYAVDRLSRNQNHIGVLFDEAERIGVRLEFVTERLEDNAMGKFIVAARAFMAELEREKIAERTMRGKAQRARSGRIPQATGKGCYGYTYDPDTGTRKVEAMQAAVVRRVFERYAETRSFSAVSNELNAAAIPSFSGGRWYPLTVRRLLSNESYAGVLVYRRTRRVKRYDPRVGRSISRVEGRPEQDWIAVQGASPRIIDQALWSRVQSILTDPERVRSGRPKNFYAMTGRAKCGLCGGAMVGQTLTTKGRPYRYYRCRHVYDRNVSSECQARYVRADALEQGLWEAVTCLLSDPKLILHELRVRNNQDKMSTEQAEWENKLASLSEQEGRLVRLYAMGNVDEKAIQDATAEIARKRAFINEQITTAQRSPSLKFSEVDEAQLGRACEVVRQWLDIAGPEERKLALEALQVSVSATKDSAKVNGVIPCDLPRNLSADEQSCPCSSSGK